ncbi:methylated-DNA--protein-cysteine methyltransferase-like [Styela clava]|uniref:methylated-DNA--protein-cysteine methyltransferase-like n=1 Tax=Styela clava TaxID=7725 RepID=UPI00193ACFFE|nr:methylated-DNA--protein-cysteine methyltransferase-like [Styela clava]XP_039272778.1 methylated-DNA--protein-cysteine methyltransferase-like [Styela clava]
MKSALCVSFLQTPIGKIKVVQSCLGVKEIILDRDYNVFDGIINFKNDDFDVSVLSYNGPWHESTDGTVDWIKLFFAKGDKRKTMSRLPKIDNEIYSKDNFTGKVLRTLATDVTHGKTVSYAQLAEMCESPKACRAVGQAMRANPIPLIVPCHRVIASNGTAGHYMSGKGDNIKKWLLDFEQKFPA